MAREIVDVTVNDVPYQIANLDPFVSFRILTRLTKLAAPSAGKLADKVGGAAGKGANLLDADLGSEAIAAVLEELADRLDETELEKTLRELLGAVMIVTPGGSPRKVNPLMDFAGEVPQMIAVAVEVIRVEYGGFLPLARSIASRLKPATSSK
ncbi:hypothetical protein D3C72_718200 [compost metagenome]